MASVAGHRDLGMGRGQNPYARTWVGRQKVPTPLGVGAERPPGAATRCLCYAVWVWVGRRWAATVSCWALAGVRVSCGPLRPPGAAMVWGSSLRP